MAQLAQHTAAHDVNRQLIQQLEMADGGVIELHVGLQIKMAVPIFRVLTGSARSPSAVHDHQLLLVFGAVHR